MSLEKSAEASQELDRQRDVYREFARAGSTLFFLVEAMQVYSENHTTRLMSEACTNRPLLSRLMSRHGSTSAVPVYIWYQGGNRCFSGLHAWLALLGVLSTHGIASKCSTEGSNIILHDLCDYLPIRQYDI